MANDFGFRDLAWFKFAGKKVYDALYPLRSREIQLDREIRDLLGKVDVKQAEMKNLHLRAVLNARQAGMTKEDIDNAVKSETEDRKKVISVPSSKEYIPGREIKEKEPEKKVVVSSKTTKPFGSKMDSWHSEDPPHKAEDLATIMQEAVKDLDKRTPRLGLQTRQAPSSGQTARGLEAYLPEEWGNNATPTPNHGVPAVTPVKRTFLGRLVSSLPGVVKEEVMKKKDDPR